MEDILHQLIGSLSHYSQGFIHRRWFAGLLPSTVGLPTISTGGFVLMNQFSLHCNPKTTGFWKNIYCNSAESCCLPERKMKKDGNKPESKNASEIIPDSKKMKIFRFFGLWPSCTLLSQDCQQGGKNHHLSMLSKDSRGWWTKLWWITIIYMIWYVYILIM